MGRFRGALLVGLFLFCVAVPSGNAQSTPTAWVDAVWIAKTDGLLKMATSDGTPILEIGDAAGIRALAIDGDRGRVWGFGPGNALRIYNFNGTLFNIMAVPVQPSLPLPISEEEVPLDLGLTVGGRIDLVVDPSSGACWLIAGNRLFRYSASGSLQNAAQGSTLNKFRALAMDAARSKVRAKSCNG